MPIVARDLIRDTALIAVLAFGSSFLLDWIIKADQATISSCATIASALGAVAAGWLFRKRHQFPVHVIWPRVPFFGYSVALALSTSAAAVLLNVAFNQQMFHGLGKGAAVSLVIFLSFIALIFAWFKLFLAMTVGSWLFGRVRSGL